MTRHAKNCTAGTVYTYHERKKDTKKSGYGSKAVRFGKDSVKDFDCCSLTLQPCRDPVITPDGYMYDREAILECLLHQKTEAARKMKAYEKQKKKQEAEEAGKMEEKERSKVESFVSLEKRITTKPKSTFTVSKEKSATGDSVQMVDEMPSTSTGSSNSESKDKNLPSFWVPSLTPQAEPTLLKKPDTKTFCPMSGKPLRIKDLIPVKLTPIDDRDGRPMVAKSERYKCAVTHDTLGNSVPCAVLKNTGHVVTMDCIEKLIRKDMLCPFTGSQLKDSDLIPLQRGGTGFAGSGVHLEAKKAGPVLQA